MKMRIINADVLEGLRQLRSNSVRLIFADPPYNQGIDYGFGKKADMLPSDEYLRWCQRWMKAAIRPLAAGGTLWVLISSEWSCEFGVTLKGLLPMRRQIVWRETFGQYQQANFTNEHRVLFYHVKSGAKQTWNPDAIRVPSARQTKYNDIRANPKGRVPGDVWKFSRVCGTFKERVHWHPTQLPEKLLERIVLCATNRGDTVLDAFAGSGSMLRVCQKHNRQFVGIDNNAEYCRKMAHSAKRRRSA